MPKAKIIVNDECNCKVTGLDTSIRKKLYNKFKYEVPGAFHIPSVKLGRWDGKIAFFQMGGGTYINLLPDILEDIEKEGYTVDLDDRRKYDSYVEPFEKVKEDSYKDFIWPEGHPVAGTPVAVRDYQVEIINGFLENPQGVQEIATGAGKTLITAILSHKCEDRGRTIVIVPNKSLVTQTEEDYINMGLNVGVYYGDRKDIGFQHTICTWQSLGALMKKTAAKTEGITIEEFLYGVVAVIVDECLDEKTLVSTSKGNVMIKDISVGDIVLTLNEQTGAMEYNRVMKRHENLASSNAEDMYEITMDDDTVLEITGNHKIKTTEGWVQAKHLTINHDIISYFA